eukprot:gnl/MRDRNA2_/MRDRNA2_66137_c0_seq1.p1 gnl/MRDRNA2_/MRDRNA2_66137_c0~~gnl/MRDRNA2_/MRDRNA2_66137_c0_seq1.p1  ORF type:complete len:171 (+),score=42.50 gnl/MRDRNA2_/MRDRNA2_66137_c0_seq1:55-513(+)
MSPAARVRRVVEHLLPQPCAAPALPGVKTHHGIDNELCGTPVSIEEGRASVKMTVTSKMRADEQGLAHGGYYFGMADYAAMLAVNDPYVVLGSAETKFLKPVKVADELVADAKVVESKDKKRKVAVSIKRGEEEVFQGSFTTFVLKKHVLDN